MGTTRLSINASIPPAGSSPKDSPEIASPSLSPVLSPSPPNYLIIIDGLIYVLQGGQPKGISVVWKNLILHLAKEFPTPNKVVFIDRIGSGLSAEIGNYPGVTATPFINNNLDSSVRSVIDQHLSRNSTHRSMIPVFLSTYYDYPWSVEGLCKIILYHDLIPENVGMHAGPGSEYYPRIEALPRVNSIVTVSDSTARDLIRLYDKDLHLVPSDPAYRLLNGSDVGTVDGEKHWWFSFGWDRVLTSIYNRISRDVFPGPSEPADIRRFREQLKLFTMDKALPYRIANQGGSSSSSNSKEDIPVDYFLTVGSDHPYKNFEPLMAAIDQLDDDLLSRVQFVMIGRGGFKDYDRGQIHRHRVIFRENGGDEQHWSPSKPVPLSTVPIRLVFGDFIAEDLLKHAYSGEHIN
jgi:glycosyltransferase involved in cell wall biosynthesis